MENLRNFWRKAFDIGPYRFGVERSRVQISGAPYLDRYILYVGVGTLRLHRFHRGDDDRAPHDHPWWFVTFPFSTYTERSYGPRPRNMYGEPLWWPERGVVKAWRFHYRPATYRHIVLHRTKIHKDAELGIEAYAADLRPFWTFVITGNRTREWGFWPTVQKFVNWREWK